MDNNVDELHASNLRHRCKQIYVTERADWDKKNKSSLQIFTDHEVDVSLLTAEMVHQPLKAMLLLTHLKHKTY